MAYEVIARRWRPQTFGEVVGQEAITRTLSNAVEQERLHHAYLFTGARGVGKTTTARILAKSLNCINGVTPTPCGTCPSCLEIARGNSLDVIEIDAASHTGVDNIRDVVITSVGIAPARDRYKVFIVDEVHQLSGAAFNALLKTLEEPPERVVFILATTELHKVPDTITSRCQLYEFRTIPLAKIQAKLAEIAAAMGITVTAPALAAVARAGEGSMRDAQSALDQVIAFSGDSIDVPDVSTSLGIVGDDTLYETLEAITEDDAASVLRMASRLAESGHDLRNFARQLMRAIRNLLFIRAIGYDAELVDVVESDAARVTDLSSRFSEAELVRAFSMLAALEQELRKSADPRFQLEIGLVRLAELPRLRPLTELVERLERLEARLTGSVPAPSAGAAPAPPRPRSTEPGGNRATGRSSAAKSSIPEPPPEPPPPYVDTPAAGAAQTLDGNAAIAEIHRRLDAMNKRVLLDAWDSAASHSIEEGRLIVRFAADGAARKSSLERSRAVIESVASEVTGRTIRFSAEVESDSPAAPPAAAGGREAAAPAGKKRGARAAGASAEKPADPRDPIVEAVIETFQGQLLAFEPPPDED